MESSGLIKGVCITRE